MPIYRVTIVLEVDGDDISWLDDTIEELRDMDGVTVAGVSPHADNPPEYPQDDW